MSCSFNCVAMFWFNVLSFSGFLNNINILRQQDEKAMKRENKQVLKACYHLYWFSLTFFCYFAISLQIERKQKRIVKIYHPISVRCGASVCGRMTVCASLLFIFIVIVFLVNTFIIPQFTSSKRPGRDNRTTETWPKVIAISLFYFQQYKMRT